MFGRQRFAVMAVAVAAAVVLLAACGGGDGSEPEPAPSGGTTTQASITAPPTLTPEEQAEADIQATFEDLIAAWDDFKANASEYVDDAAADPAWNFALVESDMRMLDDAQLTFLNSTNAFLDSEVEQVGRSMVVAVDVHDVEVGNDGSTSAQASACLDLSDLAFVTYDGASADLPTRPSIYQQWGFTIRLLQSRSGWFISSVDIEVVDVCP